MTKLSYKNKSIMVKTRLQTLDKDYSEEQLDFVLHSIKSSSYLKACPGSGKTEVVGIKAAFEISAWEDNFNGLAILSFTKNAAKEISDRVKKFGGVSATQHPHFIGTIDSWLHGYVLHPFAHKSINYKGAHNDKSFRLVDNEGHYDFLTSFKTVISTLPYKQVEVNDYYFECTSPPELQSQSRYLDLSGISSKTLKELKQNKRKFLSAGLATYADAEFLCYYLLKGNPSILRNLAARFPIIIIDECQDLSNNQLQILKLLREKGVIFHFVGDNNQSIYEFKKVYTENIKNYIKESNMKQLLLTKNFRSNQDIVDISIELEKINTGKSPSIVNGNEKKLLEKCCILWEYESTEFSELPQRFINFLNNQNLLLSNDTKIEVSKSAILARAHSTLSEFRSHPTSGLTKMELIANSLSCWSNSPRTGKDLQNALQQMGKAISLYAYSGKGDHQHQYCPIFYSQVEWRKLLSDLLSSLSCNVDTSYPFTNLTWSNWTSNIKSFLNVFWSDLNSPDNDWNAVKSKIKAPSGLATKLVIDSIKASKETYSEKIRMTTFHNIKGETLDAALVVSSKNKQSQGGHYEHWMTQEEEKKEFVRFAYVASSRPKHILIWAIPKKKNNPYMDKIMALGFQSQ